MDEYAQLRALLDLVESVDIEIRRAPAELIDGGGAHPGGALVTLRGREILFLDPDAAVAERIEVAAAALRDRPGLEDVFIPPQIRQLID